MGDAEDTGPALEPADEATGAPEPSALVEVPERDSEGEHEHEHEDKDEDEHEHEHEHEDEHDSEDEEIITQPGQRAVTSFDVGGRQHFVSVPGDRDGPGLESATSIPAIGVPEGPDSDISTSPNQRAITAFDLGASDHALKMPVAKPAPWTEQAEPIPLRLERAGLAAATGDHALPDDEDDGGGEREDDADAPPELVKPIYLDQTDPDERAAKAISRRRFVARGAAVLVAAGVGMHAWGRRPMSEGDLGYRPAVFEDSDFRTLFRAFEALLGDREAASQAASRVDLLYARLSPAARAELVDDLGLLELGPRHVLDGRRFSRLGPDRARAVLDGWRTSSLGSRRRIHADLQRLARFCWATQLEITAEAGG